MSHHRFVAALLVALLSLTLTSACDDDDDGGGRYPENTGAPCDTPDECYLDVVDRTQIQGEIQCMSRVPGGHCTHLCNDDTNCCAVDGECETGYPQVCAPLESAPEKYCFLSCEDADWQDHAADGNEYCYRFAGSAFTCRSTGGGSLNRKVCLPG